MYGKVDDIIYFVTEKGLVAPSLDTGETIVLPSGKTMPPTEVWEESPVDLKDKLNASQLALVDKFLACPPMTKLEEIAWQHHKRSLAGAKFRPPPEQVMPDVNLDALVVTSDLED